MFTPGSRGCGYKTVSGRHEWLNRDPLGEPGFELLQSVAPYRTHPLNRTPAELLQGPNLYDYVGNDPINRIDPDGRFWWLIPFAFTSWGVEKTTQAVFEAKYSSQAMLNTLDAYNDAKKKLNCKYGDDWPDWATKMMQNWNRDNINQFGSAAADFMNAVPGTFQNGNVADPRPPNGHE
jgi:hypothetical protein